MGLRYRLVQADSGSMGGSTSAEFQVLVQSGEDFLAACDHCDYAANLEVAESRAPSDRPASTATPALSKVATPNVGTIAEVSAFLKASPDRFLKSLLYLAGDQIVMAVVRGDHELNEIKLARALGVSEVVLANDEQILKATGARTGFAGPWASKARSCSIGMLPSCMPGSPEPTTATSTSSMSSTTATTRLMWSTSASVAEGDGCPRCAEGSLKIYRGIEAGSHLRARHALLREDEGLLPRRQGR